MIWGGRESELFMTMRMTMIYEMQFLEPPTTAPPSSQSVNAVSSSQAHKLFADSPFFFKYILEHFHSVSLSATACHLKLYRTSEFRQFFWEPAKCAVN